MIVIFKKEGRKRKPVAMAKNWGHSYRLVKANLTMKEAEEHELEEMYFLDWIYYKLYFKFNKSKLWQQPQK